MIRGRQRKVILRTVTRKIIDQNVDENEVLGEEIGYIYRYSETNVMHFLFSLLRIKGLYMFRALLAHPQETLPKWHLVIHNTRAIYSQQVPTISPITPTKRTTFIHYSVCATCFAVTYITVRNLQQDCRLSAIVARNTDTQQHIRTTPTPTCSVCQEDQYIIMQLSRPISVGFVVNKAALLEASSPST
jgi:hypothetical protein